MLSLMAVKEHYNECRSLLWWQNMQQHDGLGRRTVWGPPQMGLPETPAKSLYHPGGSKLCCCLILLHRKEGRHLFPNAVVRAMYVTSPARRQGLEHQRLEIAGIDLVVRNDECIPFVIYYCTPQPWGPE